MMDERRLLGKMTFGQKLREVPRQPDGDVYYLHCTGGFQCPMVDDKLWGLEPILDAGKPTTRGPFRQSNLNGFLNRNQINAVAIQHLGWHDGSYFSHWAPIVPGQSNHSRSPADYWSSIAHHISTQRISKLNDLGKESREAIASVLDDKDDVERIALSISHSLRSMDISIERMSEFYHEQLVNMLASGSSPGKGLSTTLDQVLYAHVHSFFMELGAARDYLASLAVVEMEGNPRKTDSMARLIKLAKSKDLASLKIFGLLAAKGYVCRARDEGGRWKISGWLRSFTDLRNKFLHKEPFGSRFVESFGRLQQLSADPQFYRYIRPMVLSDGTERDAFDVIVYHYRIASQLFLDGAKALGYDHSIPKLTAKNLISVGIRER